MSDNGFEPRIIGFLCNWCTYTAADSAGVGRMQQPANVDIIRVMCSGRIDPEFILKAFAEGADGVIVSGCHPPGDCPRGGLAGGLPQRVFAGDCPADAHLGHERIPKPPRRACEKSRPKPLA